MDIKEIRVWKCVTCFSNVILEKRVGHLIDEATVPDQSNCDFSKYSTPTIQGGRLLENRPSQSWIVGTFPEQAPADPPIGGICNECLEKPAIKSLLPHIRFAK